MQVLKWWVLPLGVLIITEPFYRDSWHEESLELIPQMQSVKKLQGIFRKISALGSGEFFSLAYVVAFCLMPKPAALYFFFAVSTQGFLLNQLKSMYSENRPYWESDEIHSVKCHTGFGNPSGHMFGNCFLWVTVYLHVF